MLFSYHGMGFLGVLGTDSAAEIECPGAYPICDNQCGIAFPASVMQGSAGEVDWARWA